MKRFSTIRMQLSALVLAAVVPLLLLIAFNIVGDGDRVRKETLADTLAIARVISTRLDDHVRNINTLLHAVSTMVGADLNAVDANDARLKELQTRLPGYFSSISVLAPDGRMLNSSTTSRQERGKLDFADRDYFREAVTRRGFALGAPAISRTSGKWILVAALPLLAADGSVLAVVSMSTLLERFQDLLAPTGLPAGSVMTVLNEQGIVLARSVDTQKWVGANLSASPNFRRTQVEREFVDETVASDGVTRLAGYTTARAVPWVVYVGIPGNIALEKVRMEILRHSALALFVIIIAVTLAYLLARRITRPIEVIAEVTQQVAAGLPDVRIEPAGAAEIAEVSTRFNHMLDEMAQAQKSLRESEAHLRSIIDGLGPQMFVGLLTPDGVIIEANQPALTAAGLKREDVLGKPVEQTYWFAYSESVQRQLRSAIKAAAAGTPCRYDMEIRINDTQRLWIDFSLHPLRNASGRVTFLVPSALVIAERKKAEEQVTRQLAELQRWFDATLDREEQMIGMKREVNELLTRLGQPPRYSNPGEPAAENPRQTKA